MEDELKELIKKCDLLIKQEDFDNLIDFYTDDAVLVVKPMMIARGREEIKKAFIAISKYFDRSLTVKQENMIVIEAGDTALVISQALLGSNLIKSEYPMERRATYVFKKNSDGKWKCAIDNSYGTDLINDFK